MKRTRGILIVPWLALVAVLPSASANAGEAPTQDAAPLSGITAPGGFLLSPTRIVLGGPLRAAQLTLVNNGNEPAVYRLSLIRMRMSEDGRLEEIAEPDSGESFADTLVRYAPRQVELEPGVVQTVRLQLRAPADLPAGEYRSHLLIRAVPRSLAAPAPRDTGARGLAIELTPIYGAAIPVIVRQGATEATVAIANARLMSATAGQPMRLVCSLTRGGTRSIYGDVVVTLVSRSGKRREVGRLNGVAVYTPNRLRRIEVPVDVSAARRGQDRLEVRFEESGLGHGLAASAAIDLD